MTNLLALLGEAGTAARQARGRSCDPAAAGKLRGSENRHGLHKGLVKVAADTAHAG
ncbi:hypothetical protein [Noviherbaspirillum pedocola]|uniref:Uncharacterized protein n=1 Tax=Noviherbaspirillum pedocola TaxID=2801341 RepID=A0A934SQ28_9BURK|nr:hypothetical protein [Noviherbaspirillum pedocola]MBK4734520.1 hypothetical protein [Noviherbaspirillum pedocola]